MDVGLLTAPFRREGLEEVVEFAASAGFSALEIAVRPGSPQLDPASLDAETASSIRGMLERQGVRISSLASYVNTTEPDPEQRQAVQRSLFAAVDAAVALGTDVVCTLAGMPVPGKDKMQTIEDEVPGALGPVVEYAGERGVRIALENWFATNIQHLDHWERLFEVLPAANFGLNFDPSHLYWQQIDYLAAVEQFAARIFHTHAKDCEVQEHRLRRLGVLERGWWRYVIPGFGRIDWGEYVAALRAVGYDGVLSIEHEDRTFGPEEGFLKGLAHLEQFV